MRRMFDGGNCRGKQESGVTEIGPPGDPRPNGSHTALRRNRGAAAVRRGPEAFVLNFIFNTF